MRPEYASYHTCLIFLLNFQYFKNQPFLKRRCTLERHAACAWSGSLHAAWLNTDLHQLCNLGSAPIFFYLGQCLRLFFIIPQVWLTLSNCQSDKNNPINYFHSYFEVILKEFLNYKFNCLELSLVTKKLNFRLNFQRTCLVWTRNENFQKVACST